MLAVANQKPGVRERYGLTRDETDREVWALEPGGSRSGGAAAVNRVLQELGGPWRILSLAYRLRPVAAVQNVLYGWFARNRSRFSRFGITPECDQPGSDCE